MKFEVEGIGKRHPCYRVGYFKGVYFILMEAWKGLWATKNLPTNVIPNTE